MTTTALPAMGRNRPSPLDRIGVKYTNQLAHANGIFGQWKPQIVAKFGSSMLPICNKNGREIRMEYQMVILCSRTDFVTT